MLDTQLQRANHRQRSAPNNTNPHTHTCARQVAVAARKRKPGDEPTQNCWTLPTCLLQDPKPQRSTPGTREGERGTPRRNGNEQSSLALSVRDLDVTKRNPSTSVQQQTANPPQDPKFTMYSSTAAAHSLKHGESERERERGLPQQQREKQPPIQGKRKKHMPLQPNGLCTVYGLLSFTCTGTSRHTDSSGKKPRVLGRPGINPISPTDQPQEGQNTTCLVYVCIPRDHPTQPHLF